MIENGHISQWDWCCVTESALLKSDEKDPNGISQLWATRAAGQSSEENNEQRALAALRHWPEIKKMGQGFVVASDLIVSYNNGDHHDPVDMAFVARKVGPHGEKASPW